MFSMPNHLVPEGQPMAHAEAIVRSGPVRVTVLTPQLLRIEYSPDAVFEDRPSYAFWNRALLVPEFDAVERNGVLTIETKAVRLEYSGGGVAFTGRSLRADVLATGETWHLGDREWDHNLGGTIRTLDNINGRTGLGLGLMSRKGWSVIDDSGSVVFDKTGWFARRRDPSDSLLLEQSRDLYLFAYGHEYAKCLADFYRVSGLPPTLPKYAHGVWWSRYWPYTDQELIELIEQFREARIPLTVSIADMDWHITKNEYTNGWTGFTWNKEYFPDPERFLRSMHERGVRVGLNLHPADGVYPHEAMYDQMVRAMGDGHDDGRGGATPAWTGDERAAPVPFEPENARFMEAYLRLLHRPLEKQGIDLWWIDWQQGDTCGLPGLDPLAALNHAHFLDLRREGGDGVVLSRYGGLGSHRYPVGFSGDSIATWESLAFQPELTATAANVGYGCWSHDIGGHMAGTGDPELYVRWVQFGALSPVLRVHSSRNPYNVRLPWEFDGEVGAALTEAFRLRGRLIPYIHTALTRHAEGGLPLCTPMYYHYPDCDEAYEHSAQYMFGGDLLAAPFVDPTVPAIGLSRRVIWIPPGRWYHFFTGECFEGPRRIALYGTIREIPLFAREGALIPMHDVDTSPTDPHPGSFSLLVFPTSPSRAELREEDGVIMLFEQRNGANELDLEVSIEADRDALAKMNSRSLSIVLRGYAAPHGVYLSDDPSGSSPAKLDSLPLVFNGTARAHLRWDDRPTFEPHHLRSERVRRLLRALAMPDTVKRTVGGALDKRWSLEALRGSVEQMSPAQTRALAETIAARAFEDVLLS
ncbi:MAG: TIM-barrel domain-containing protein [Spirochaetales bacterium]